MNLRRHLPGAARRAAAREATIAAYEAWYRASRQSPDNGDPDLVYFTPYDRRDRWEEACRAETRRRVIARGEWLP